MNVGRTILVWAARHMLALILIILILVAARLVVPPAARWIGQQMEVARQLPAERNAYAQARKAYARHAAERKLQARDNAARLSAAPEEELRRRRDAIPAAMAREREAVLSGGRLALAAARGDGDRIFGHYRAEAEIGLLRRELALIDALLAARGAERQRANLAEQRAQAVAVMAASRARWQAARDRARVLERRPLAPARDFMCRNAQLGIGCRNYRALAEARAEMQAAAERHQAARRRIAAIDPLLAGIGAARANLADAGALIDAQSGRIDAELRRIEQAAGANWVVWIGRPIVEVLPTALGILAIAMLTPLLVKAFLFFLVAPLAARRPPLRLSRDDRGEIEALGASAASQPVRLEPGDEILLVPEAVQSTPELAEKRTQWLLAWSMPLSSLASGMVALVRIRVERPDAVIVSASEDGHSEVVLVRIAAGSSLVLRPRALRGLVQPIGSPVRITRHWRLAHLSAWLTLQFRYLAFHGPGLLIVEGVRGVRVEPAGSGRGINQAATLGFAAGLAYSVSRSEAFGAYLLGKQELFNDRFAGSGPYLYEEVPRLGAKRGLWGRGLRGLGDAALKIFGL